MRPRGWAALAAAIGAGGWIARYHAYDPTSQLFGPTLCRGRRGSQSIALTYDDGPDRWTAPMLELLDRLGVKATFFVIGAYAEQDPGTVRAIAEAGHAVGNHTWSHPKLGWQSTATVREELARADAALARAGVAVAEVDGAKLMRPPYGHRRPGTIRAVREAGYLPVMWSVTGFDWVDENRAEDIAENCAAASGGDIILLHDGSENRSGDRGRSVAASELIIERLAAEGYRFVTVPELLAVPPAAG